MCKHIIYSVYVYMNECLFMDFYIPFLSSASRTWHKHLYSWKSDCLFTWEKLYHMKHVHIKKSFLINLKMFYWCFLFSYQINLKNIPFLYLITKTKEATSKSTSAPRGSCGVVLRELALQPRKICVGVLF